MVAMLAQVDALPGSQRDLSPTTSGNVSVGPSSEALMCAGMSSLPSSVCVHSTLRSGAAAEPSLEVAAHFRAGVLVQRERGGGVQDQQVQQADRHFTELRQLGEHLVRHEVKAAGAGLEGQFALQPHRRRMRTMSELRKANILGATFAYDDTDPEGYRSGMAHLDKAHLEARR